MSVKIWGIDVSKYNYPIHWVKVKAAGVKFAILRCGYASLSNRNRLIKDPHFDSFYQGAKDVGLPVGAYFYSRCNSVETAKREASFIIDCIKGKKFEYPIWLDVEDATTLKSTSREELTKAVKTCLEELEKAGYYVGIYTGKYVLRDNLYDDQLKDYDLWLAQYARRYTYTTYPISMWQFGAEVNFLTKKEIPGIGSDVADQNYCYKDYPSIIKSKKLNGYRDDDNDDNRETDDSDKTEDSYVTGDLPFYIKTVTEVNIRKEPSTNSEILYHAPSGVRYKITKFSANKKWGYAPYRKGWITLNTKYVKSE